MDENIQQFGFATPPNDTSEIISSIGVAIAKACDALQPAVQAFYQQDEVYQEYYTRYGITWEQYEELRGVAISQSLMGHPTSIDSLMSMIQQFEPLTPPLVDNYLLETEVTERPRNHAREDLQRKRKQSRGGKWKAF